MNFSYPQEYHKVIADPITVVARELGTGIPRNKIFAAFQQENPRKRGKANSTRSKATKDSNTGSLDDEETAYADTTAESIDPPTPEAEMEVDVPADECTSSAMQVETLSPSILSAADKMEFTTSETAGTLETTEIDSREDSKQQHQSTPAKPKKDFYLSPNEPVFQGSKIYPPLFCFWQLIGWFNAGTDEGIVAPDLFGCAQLPEPIQCFGNSDINYGEKQRETLIEILMDEKRQTMPWPQSLKSSFSFAHSTQQKPVYGSPMLDIALGQVDAVIKVLRELKFQKVMMTAAESKKFEASLKKSNTGVSSSSSHAATSSSAGKGKGKNSKQKMSVDEATQYDNILPPELPTSWVQCEKCKKWRRVAWNVDVETLVDDWDCSMNTWDLDNATCDAPQDSYDPSKENTFDYKAPANMSSNTLENSTIGSWRDVYCLKNLVYYEAQIKKVKLPKKAQDKAKILFHYKGWSPKFDEWIAFDSDRIQPHHLFTNPDATDPRQQEAWQGRSPVKATIRSAISVPSKKRKSLDGKNEKQATVARKKRNIVKDSDNEIEDNDEDPEGMVIDTEIILDE